MKVYPSLMACNLLEMGSEIARVRKADGIHLDIMDGVFVPNMTFGTGILKSIKQISKKQVMVHLMVEHPDKAVKQFMPFLSRKDLVFVHAETNRKSVDAALKELRRKKIPAGIVLNPGTRPFALGKWEKIKNVLVMGVHPGFYGQRMIKGTDKKVRKILEQDKFRKVFVDGGVTLKNAAGLKRAGACGACSGKEVFGARSPSKAIDNFHKL